MSTEEMTLSPVSQDHRISQAPWMEAGLNFDCSKQLPTVSSLGIQPKETQSILAFYGFDTAQGQMWLVWTEFGFEI